MFLWYDDENNNFVELETTLNKAKSTASITTNHFSKYMIVDKQAWFDNWREIYDKYKALPTQPSVTSICVDCSGSMSGNDPNFQIADRSYSCYRKMAVEGFADAMLDNDQTNIITFDNSAKEICTFTNNKDTVKSKAKFYSNGGTNANSAVIIALGKLNGKSGNKSIILMSDGDVNITKENINLAVENNIKIHTIGLGSGADNSSLKAYAEQTGGEFFKVTTAVGLEDIYNKLSVKNQFNFDNMSDSDGDGVPDDIEISGIPMPSGEIVYPDPNNKHSDDDGLTDGEEVGMLVRNPATPACTPDAAVEYKFYFNIKSDPTKVDSDGDEFLDNNDSNPLIPYLTRTIWKDTDSKYSTTVQIELLKLELSWDLSSNDVEKMDLEERADEIRETMSSGIGSVLDTAKTIFGAASDEFAWFLGGDVDLAERDYWLSEVNKVNPEITIDNETTFHSIMFIAGIIQPSPDDAWRLISKKATKEMLEKVDESVIKKFLKSISKRAAAEGTNGIKKLSGNGIKGYMYEVKVKGKGGAYRLLGNKTDNGEIFWEVFEKTHK